MDDFAPMEPFGLGTCIVAAHAARVFERVDVIESNGLVFEENYSGFTRGMVHLARNETRQLQIRFSQPARRQNPRQGSRGALPSEESCRCGSPDCLAYRNPSQRTSSGALKTRNSCRIGLDDSSHRRSQLLRNGNLRAERLPVQRRWNYQRERLSIFLANCVQRFKGRDNYRGHRQGRPGRRVIADQDDRSIRQMFRVVATQPAFVRQVRSAVRGNCLAQDKGFALPQRLAEEIEENSRSLPA